MKYFFYIVLLTLFMGCSASKKGVNYINYSQYKIVETPLLVEKDTLLINELRFFKIKSIKDVSHIMYSNFGVWDEKTQGFHQNAIGTFIWKNVKLLPNSEELFTVIADGKETSNDYFACVMIFDSQSKDCLKEANNYKDKITNFFRFKMNTLKRDPEVYTLLSNK